MNWKFWKKEIIEDDPVEEVVPKVWVVRDPVTIMKIAQLWDDMIKAERTAVTTMALRLYLREILDIGDASVYVAFKARSIQITENLED